MTNFAQNDNTTPGEQRARHLIQQFQENANNATDIVADVLAAIANLEATPAAYVNKYRRRKPLSQATQLILDGVVCDQCGEYLGDPIGHPRTCLFCEQPQEAFDDQGSIFDNPEEQPNNQPTNN